MIFLNEPNDLYLKCNDGYILQFRIEQLVSKIMIVIIIIIYEMQRSL